MDWIRQNKTCATILGVFGVGALVLGVVFYLGWSDLGSRLDDFDSLKKKVSNMEKNPLYPSEPHLTELENRVNAFGAAAGELSGQLIEDQKAAEAAAVASVKALTDTEFQARLKERIAATKEQFGADRLPKNFAFGFDLYTTRLPEPAAAEPLHHYFSAVDAVVTAALEAGVAKIDSLQRTDLMVEKGQAAQQAADAAAAAKAKEKAKTAKSSKGKNKSKAAPAKPARAIAQVVERRTLTMQFTTDQVALQILMNSLASKAKVPYFTAVRVLRVENEKQEGPLRSATLPKDDTPKDNGKAAKLGENEAPHPAPHDAFMVLGGEKIRVYAEIDLVRFLDPPAETADASK